MRADRVLLVIDDSATIRKLVELSFASTSWTLEFAESGERGLQRAAETSPHAILLDYVLPDMRGTEVCRRLLADPKLAKVPVLVMSAKEDGGRSHFEGVARLVADFVVKPFAAAEIVARVNRAAEAVEAVQDASAPEGHARLDFAQKQALAQAIYEKLRPQLLLIPEWVAELGAGSPAAFFSRKLLTPRLIDDLRDIFAQLPVAAPVASPASLASPASPAAEPPALPSLVGADFRGELGAFPLFDLIRALLESTRRDPGALELRSHGQRTRVYLRDGRIEHVTSNNPELHLRGAAALPELRAELRAAAEEEQRTTGRPALLAWFAEGLITSDELCQRLSEQGRRLLVSASRQSGQQFSWLPQALPDPDQVGPVVTIPLASLELEKLRQETTSSEVERSPICSDVALTRAPLFSHKLRELALTTAERDVLALVNGERNWTTIASALSLPPHLVAAVLYRLLCVDLICLPAPAPSEAPASSLLILDADETTFVAPLRRLLAKSVPPRKVIRLGPEESVRDAALRESAGVVVINASSHSGRAARAAAELRSDTALKSTQLIALLDAPAAEQASQLETLGFDAVLSKPLLRADLEVMLGGART
ncbi:MAG TPA: response regulator [Polyangiaceae bacterium]|nr:response regulator [Polyangiaceae bacterium]